MWKQGDQVNNVEEMIAVVQAYINHRKGVTVNIEIRNGEDIFKLMEAYNIAMEWFSKNNGSITQVRNWYYE